MLPDLLTPNLALVLCGTAASTASAAVGHYYAGRGNKFWRILHETGLTPRRLAPAEYRDLLTFGIGLTDVAKDQSGSDADIDFHRSNPGDVRDKMQRLQPAVLAFNGKQAAKVFFGRRLVEYELQPERIGRTRLFIAPSTSGAASGRWDSDIWHDLAALTRELTS